MVRPLSTTVYWYLVKSMDRSHTTLKGAELPLVTAGLAGGRVTGGRYIDFSDQQSLSYDATTISLAKPGMQSEYTGLHYNQFLANCMLAMGVPKTEWETSKLVTDDGPSRSPTVSGYGSLVSGGQRYVQAEQVLSEPLPCLLQSKLAAPEATRSLVLRKRSTILSKVTSPRELTKS